MKFSHTTILNIIIFIVIILIIYFLCNQTESFSGTLTPQSNEAVQQVASIFNNKKMVVDTIQATNQFMGNVTGNVTGNVVGDVTGNLTGNANINTLKSNVSGNPINVNSPLLLQESLRPIILSVAIGSTTCPITDLSGNTFSSDKYICKVLAANNYMPSVAVKNKKWWIGNSLWNNWQICILEFTPITNYNVYSLYNDDTSIVASDGTNIGATDWINGRGFVNNGYYVFDSKGVAHPVTPPSS